MVQITKEELVKLVETAIQFGIDSPELVTNQKSRLKISSWMVENTIKDIGSKTIFTVPNRNTGDFRDDNMESQDEYFGRK